MPASNRTPGQSRLGLESLEAREVPAVVFVGGWGAATNRVVDPDSPNVAYLGASARSAGIVGRVTGVVVDPAPSRDFPLDIRGVDAESRGRNRDGIIVIRDPVALGPPHVSRDQFVFGVELPRASGPQHPRTARNGVAGDGTTEQFFTVELSGGVSSAQSGPGSLGIEVHAVRHAQPLPVLLVIADQRD